MFEYVDLDTTGKTPSIMMAQLGCCVAASGPYATKVFQILEHGYLLLSQYWRVVLY